MEFYSGYTGIDLRDEFEEALDGDYFESRRGQKVILRHLTDRTCACFDAKTGSPNSDCPYCDGEGYLWYETNEVLYIARLYGNVMGATTNIRDNNQTQMGLVDDKRAVCYARVATWPNFEQALGRTRKLYDKLYELKGDDTGEPVYSNGVPIRVAKWRVQSTTLHLADGGRPTYFECELIREAL